MAKLYVGNNGIRKIFTLLKNKLLATKRIYTVNMDTSNLEGGLSVIEYGGVIYITFKVKYNKDIPAWNGAKIGTIKDWLGLEIQFEVCGTGDSGNIFQNTVCLIQSNGEIWLTTHGATNGLNWFYGSIAVVI